MNLVYAIRKHVTIEPVLLIVVVGIGIAFALFRPALVTKICFQVGQKWYPGERIDCDNLREYPRDFYEEVEKVSADLNAWNSASTVVSVFSAFIWSAWADRVGRKGVMMISIAGGIISMCINVVMIAIPLSPLWLYPLTSILVGFTGGTRMILTSCSQYVADNVKDKRKLTMRMTILFCVFSVGFTIGALLSVLLTKVVSVPMGMAIGAFLAFPSMFYVLLFVEQRPPPKHDVIEIDTQQSVSSIATVDSGISTDSGQETEQNQTHTDASVEKPAPNAKPPTSDRFLPYIWSLLVDIWVTYTKNRPGRRRFFIWLSVVAYFSVTFASDGYEGLNTTYIMTPPLSFTTQTYPYYIVAIGLIVTVGSSVGGFIAKKLELSDTMVMVISMVSTSLHPLVYGLATENWMIYLGICLGCLGMLVIGAFQSYLVQLVEPHEVGKMIAGQQFTVSVGDLVSGVVMSKIYKYTVHSCRGAAYFASFGLCVLSTIFLLVVHFGSRSLLKESRAHESMRRQQRQDVKAVTPEVMEGGPIRDIDGDSGLGVNPASV